MPFFCLKLQLVGIVSKKMCIFATYEKTENGRYNRCNVLVVSEL